MLPQKIFEIRIFNLAEMDFRQQNSLTFLWLLEFCRKLSDFLGKFPDFYRFSRSVATLPIILVLRIIPMSVVLKKQIENKTHFLLECPCYNNLRQGFMVNLIGHNFSTDSPASPKYTEFLFTSEDQSILIPLANFIKSALTERYISITFNQKIWLQSQT